MIAEGLSEALNSRHARLEIDAAMRFSAEGLMLGAGTVMIRGSGREILLDPNDSRLQALLVAAHLRRPSVEAMTHLRKATERWREGQDGLAIMHLALSRLERLERPEADALRLSLAGRLLDRGVEADAIIRALESDAAGLERLEKYTGDQPRVPAGSGRTSGQWTVDGSGEAVAPGRPPRSVVNPETTTRVAGHYVGDDACHRASNDCQRNIIRDSQTGQANDTWDINRVLACKSTELRCESLGPVVENTKGIIAGGAVFPDGGIVVILKGKEDTYFPAIRPSHLRRAL